MNADGTNQRPLTTPSSGSDESPAWSPDGTRIAFTRVSGPRATSIVVVNVDGTGEHRLSPAGRSDGNPAWSPDGSKIAFVSKPLELSELWVMRSDGTHRRRLLHVTAPRGPVFAPFGLDWRARRGR
jgi:TolB protein